MAAQAPQQVTQVHSTNAWAIVGFIFAFLIPLLGLVFSIIGLVQIRKSGEKGEGLAIAGIIISSILTIIVVIFLFFIIATIGIVMNSPYYQAMVNQTNAAVCTVPDGFSCGHLSAITPDGKVVFVLENNLSTHVSSANVSMAGIGGGLIVSCSPPIKNWAYHDIRMVSCKMSPGIEGADFTITYSTVGVSQLQSASGRIMFNRKNQVAR